MRLSLRPFERAQTVSGRRPEMHDGLAGATVVRAAKAVVAICLLC